MKPQRTKTPAAPAKPPPRPLRTLEIFAMAILPIVQYPDQRLAQKAKPVTVFDDKLAKLAEDMAQTMYEAPGVGLAAPQVGELIRMVVIDISDEKNDLHVLVNPVIEAASDEVVECEEGCLSLPGLYEKVKRPARVKVKYQNLKGEPHEMECDELMSVCAQHEIDHLDGTVFIDHLSMLKKQRAAAKLAKMRKEKARAAKHKDQ